jgi:hypothetical protein
MTMTMTMTNYGDPQSTKSTREWSSRQTTYEMGFHRAVWNSLTRCLASPNRRLLQTCKLISRLWRRPTGIENIILFIILCDLYSKFLFGTVKVIFTVRWEIEALFRWMITQNGRQRSLHSERLARFCVIFRFCSSSSFLVWQGCFLGVLLQKLQFFN